jgi:hypothetical protein
MYLARCGITKPENRYREKNTDNTDIFAILLCLSLCKMCLILCRIFCFQMTPKSRDITREISVLPLLGIENAYICIDYPHSE